MSFCTVISCIDGRVQLPVITYLQNRFGVKFVDNVTEAGPVGVLSVFPEFALSDFKSCPGNERVKLRQHILCDLKTIEEQA